MLFRTIIHTFLKLTFLDELLGLLYCALVIYGLIKIGEYDANVTLRILATLLYIFVVIFVYFTLARKMNAYFKTEKKSGDR